MPAGHGLVTVHAGKLSKRVFIDVDLSRDVARQEDDRLDVICCSGFYKWKSVIECLIDVEFRSIYDCERKAKGLKFQNRRQ